MVDLATVNQQITSSVFGGITKNSIINAVGWLVAGIIIVGLAGWFIWWWTDKKKYNRKIKAYEIVGAHYVQTYSDVARSTKLGKGGFEVLYLKKAKTWKLAHGGRSGKNEYYFFIQPDGYWYNGQIAASVNTIDKNGGLIPIVTTNPTMRSQYTALEKQIDSLHGEKVSFWDKYGNWILSISFVLIIGVLAWLIYREMSGVMGSIAGLTDKMTSLTEQLTKLTINLNSAKPSGLVPA